MVASERATTIGQPHSQLCFGSDWIGRCSGVSKFGYQVKVSARATIQHAQKHACRKQTNSVQVASSGMRVEDVQT